MKPRHIVMLVGSLGASLLSLSPSAAAPGAGAGIRLRNATIDTSAAAQQVQAGALTARNKVSDDCKAAFARHGAVDRRLPFIVQFTGPVQSAWKQELEQIGARLGGYLPENAFIAELTSAQLNAATDLECVQWLGPYQPAYKTDPPLNRRFATGDQAIDTFTIETFSSETVPAVRQAILDRNGLILATATVGERGLLRARMSMKNASELADLPAVEFIEIYVEPRLCNNVATDGEHMNLQSLWTQHDLTGAGQIVCVADTGLDTGNTNTIHPDFSNRVIAAFALGREDDWSDSTANFQGGHGTHVAGSVLGSGAAWGNGLFRGPAYSASLVFQSLMDSEGKLGGIPDALTNLFYQGYTSGARIHTDSWGAPIAGAYNADAQSTDQFMWDVRDMLILFSAGNSGIDAGGRGIIDPTSIGAPGTAKNVLTVGASESKRPSGDGGYSAYTYYDLWPSDYPANPIRQDLLSSAYDTYQGMAAFSSRGPCLDGRFKPDIVAPGTDIVSCRSRMPGAETGWGTGYGVLANAASNYYLFMGGTSMSTPLTAGAAALTRQYLQAHRGYAAPSAALMKAILVNGARSLTPGQYGVGPYREIPAARPNNVEGWGQVDLANTLFPAAGWTNVYYDITNTAQSLVTGAKNTYLFSSSGTAPIHITLCWSDYPASLAATKQLVNDLDLSVITPDNIIHYPNGLAQADRINNTEGIDLPATAGTIQIKVSGYNVPNGPQPYALVIRGAGAALTPPPSLTAIGADFDGDRKADPAVYAPANGWYIWFSSKSYTREGPYLTTTNLGLAMAADFDGDGLADPALWLTSSGWLIHFSASDYALNGPYLASSLAGVGCAGDVDGDGKADPALYQPTAGWYFCFSAKNYEAGGPFLLGAPDVTPVLADFDGDRKADPALYRATDGWYIWFSAQDYRLGGPFLVGAAGYSALAADFDGDGLADPALYQDTTGGLYVWQSGSGHVLSGPFGPYTVP